MKMRHIVQVSAYYPPHLGGQENAVHDLAQQLAAAGQAVHVLTSTQGGGIKGTTHENGVTVRRLPGYVFGHAPVMPGFAWALAQTAKNTSVVHLHIGQAFTPEIVWLIAALRRFRYIAQLHIDFEPSGPAGFLLPLYKRLVLKRVLQSAAVVVVLNKKTLRIVRGRYGYTGLARVMNNGIDEAYFTLPRPPLTVKPPRMLRLLFVGRLSKQKNIGALIAALALTKRKIHVDLVGDGEQRQAIQAKIALHNLKNVKLHGRLARSQVLDLYATCDALIMPSLYEAQPLVLLEALAARIPIIGTDVIGIAEHIKDAGIIVKPTPEGLCKGIEEFYSRYDTIPARVAQGFAIAQKFRWNYTLKKYQELYAEVARY